MREEAYAKGYHDGAIAAKKEAEAIYTERLLDIADACVCSELRAAADRERSEAVYNAWNRIFHYMNAVCGLLETDMGNKDRICALAEDIREEVTAEYLVASDEYYSHMYNDEEFVESCRRGCAERLIKERIDKNV